MDNFSSPIIQKINFFKTFFPFIIAFIFIIISIIMHNQKLIYISVLISALAIGILSIIISELAEFISTRIEEPYASFVLTFSAVVVEIIILFLILLEASHSPQVQDTIKAGIISAVIVDINVLLGLAVFIGGLTHKEQKHNENTSSIYTTILLVAACALLVSSILPDSAKESGTLFYASISISVILMLFYIGIFIFQTKTHSYFFKVSINNYNSKKHKKEKIEYRHEEKEYIKKVKKLSNTHLFIAIFFLICLIGLMAEIFAKDGILIAKEYGISAGLSGLIIAIIAVAPEIVTAINAAKQDQIQRVVNIAMGASTVSIMLTVPILMLLAYSIGIELTLDFNEFQIGALLLTVILAWKTTADGETNYFEGLSHLIFFMFYIVIAILN